MKHVDIFTDGACMGNPGKGGWGALLRYKGTDRELSGGFEDTTNNRMELTAVLQALYALKEPCEVTLTTDSRYVVEPINKGWLETWKRKGWRTLGNKPVANTDLWEELCDLLDIHTVNFVWVKGHNGHPENERCDKLAVKAYQNI